MTTTTGGHLSERGLARVVRGTCVGTVAVGVSTGGHSLGGGAVTPTAVAIPALVAAIVCVAMSRVEWTVRRLTGVVLIAQAGLHLFFMASSSHHVMGSATAMLCWHLVATAVSVVAIRYAESALAGLVERVALRRAAPRVGLVAVVRRQRLGLAYVGSDSGVRVARSLPIRGPPRPSYPI